MGSIQFIPDTSEMQGQHAPIPQPTGEWIKNLRAIAGSDSTGASGTAAGDLSEDEARDVAVRRCFMNVISDCSQAVLI
ncbi:hypothetical protein [Xanthomonas nasturtii]|uniref:hypothetical protein n=1 Tax=Xanthomonas nasturtii TaxID=1843581 RepID=UPI0012902757|nr:hypothetical protein [Xanthomonas nasturtii]WVL55295.1 hypothetical protein M3O54_012570 [Xanthomonas nasturtii]